jgi:hypothetical protein
VFVLWSLAVLFILLTGVIISIYRKKFPLFTYSMVVVTVCYLLLSFAHPDYLIARCNAANMGNSVSSFFDTDSYHDYTYMTYLSADAAPALKEVLSEEGFLTGNFDGGGYNGWQSSKESWGYSYLNKVNTQYEDMGIRSFNLSKYIAYHLLY